MLAIRLSRVGHKNWPRYRLIVQEKKYSPKSSRFVEILGSYNPTDDKNTIEGLSAEAVKKHLDNGAVPSDTVARLLKKNGVEHKSIDKAVKKYTHKIDPEKVKAEEEARQKAAEEAKAKAEAEAAIAAEAEKPAEEVAPVEEEKKEESEEKPAE